MLHPYRPATTTLILFIFFRTFTTQSQTIDAKLFYQPTDIPASSRNLTLEPLGARKMDHADLKKFLSQWQKFLIETRDNLLDDSLFLKRDYDLLWKDFYEDFKAEVEAAIIFCKTETDNSGLTYKYIPAPSDILSFVNSLSIVEIKKTSSDVTMDRWQVIRANPFEEWLFQWFNGQILGSFPFMEIDIQYIKDWRNLEQIFNSSQTVIDTLTDLINKKWEMDHFKRIIVRVSEWSDLIKNNTIIKYLQTNDNFSKKSLWFTRGILQMNPLQITDPSREYPARERNSFVPPGFYHEIDSLKKIKFHKQLFTTNKVHNEIIIPVAQPKLRIRYTQYDAANNYVASGEPNGMIEQKTDKLVTVIHNIPAEKSIEMKVTGKETIPNKSRAQLQVEEVLGPIGEAVKLFSPLAAAAGRLLTRPAITVKYIIPTPSVSIKSLSLDSSIIDGPSIASLNKILFPGDPEDDPINALLTTLFLIGGSPEPFDDRKPKESVKKLKDQYQQFLYGLADVMIDDFTEESNKLLPVIRIYNRSLPPSKLEEYTNPSPAFSTDITETDLPSATAKINYAIIEKGEKPGDQRQVAQTSFTLGKKLYWNISAGIEYTFFDEYVTTPPVSSGVPDIQPATDFQFTATLHIYPWGINNLNDRFGGSPKERFSLYAGLGITRPLDNYYGGFSYDLVPGFKLMAGVHYYRKTRYKIINDQIAEKAAKFDFMGPTLGFHVDYTTLGTILGFFK